MKYKFELDEVVIILDGCSHIPAGSEGTVVAQWPSVLEAVLDLGWDAADLMMYGALYGVNTPFYGVKSHGTHHLYGESGLKKKQPPAEVSTWDRIKQITHWNPTKQTVH